MWGYMFFIKIINSKSIELTVYTPLDYLKCCWFNSRSCKDSDGFA